MFQLVYVYVLFCTGCIVMYALVIFCLCNTESGQMVLLLLKMI